MSPQQELTTVSEGGSANVKKKPDLLHSRDEVRWNATAHDDALECNILSCLRIGLHGLDITHDLGEPPSTTSLLPVGVAKVDALCDGLSEGYTTLSSGAINVVFPSHSLNVNLRV